ncbi:UNVERIFIED_CONTAM: hypothetical protein FKN15_034772 [Acipenser sinensis]
MDRNALAELLQALESRRDAEERRREERYTALIERPAEGAVVRGLSTDNGTQDHRNTNTDMLTGAQNNNENKRRNQKGK